ncbi:hypothetical protein [Microbacterium sp. SORGH_AS_0862]|uniref:hypothetical protein n=1 Tax=Microbacterium sp. SORGH_AS_0862 TaxID=3041789 RepID=UPI002790EE8A|nr:hypothetical protein [Microbacterium sp. SORGH_AS_0862]MDQ1206213.1 outer membrane murein-binding lipoprotein Lpp [Microbacterium sp. SORGH_AS_0862]
MKRPLLAAAGIAAVLLLAGCSAPQTDTADTNRVSESTTAPLTAETPDVDSGEAAYLTAVRAALRPDNVIPNATDEQLLAAGEKACEAIAKGKDTSALSVIDGEPDNGYGAYLDSGAIITAAATTLC